MKPSPRPALIAQIQALRTWRVPPYPLPLQTALPLALLASSDEPVMVGHLKLLRIDGKRYQRELKRGLLDVFRIGNLYAVEVWIDREGPWTDYLVED